MGPTHFPLRWESTGDQWWFASPIDWAAANGHHDIVRELLRIDPNLLINLTSLPRIRRLETVWDDAAAGGEEEDFRGVAVCRSRVAQKLLQECETKNKNGRNSLIGAGYGGWLLYTAASAGDEGFAGELLARDPLLVFGEGEYGVTDMLYAAARSGSREVFGMLFDCAVSPRGLKEVSGGVFRSEMVNRAVHAAAGGGSVEVLRGLLEGGGEGDVLGYRDAGGSTVLHTASARGRVEVVRHLISSSPDIVNSVDKRGNTSVHVAAYHGHLPVLHLLLSSSPPTALLTNNNGDTFLHAAISGFRSPTFRRMDRHTDLVKQIIRGDKINNIINVQNNEGRTALHLAVTSDVKSEIVDLLMSARSVNPNIRDADGRTPLDLLRRRRPLISAGGISECPRNALVARLMRRPSNGDSTPGTCFGIPDAEILLYADEDLGSSSSCDDDLSGSEYSSKCHTFGGPVKSATRHLKNLLRWPNLEEEYCSLDSCRVGFSSSLRQQFCEGSVLPSPSTKRKFVRGLTQGVLQVVPSAISESASPVSRRENVNVESPNMKGKSFNLRLMNNYLCFGAQSLGVQKSLVAKTHKQETVLV